MIRSDDGAGFTAMALMKWLRDRIIELGYIKPDSHWQNGSSSVLTARCYECLNQESFVSRRPAKPIFEKWPHFYEMSGRILNLATAR